MRAVCHLLDVYWPRRKEMAARAGLVSLAALWLQLLGLGIILDPRLFLGHATNYFPGSAGPICYRWASYCPS